MKILTAILPFLLAACSNPYARFYKGMSDARMMPQYTPVDDDLRIYSTDNFERDIDALVRKGYLPIGQSSFNTGEIAPESQLRRHARKVGAHIALVSTKYTHTVSGAVPLVLPNVTSSYSAGTATAYGSSGMVNAFGSGTTTTYGTQTTILPYSIERYDVGVVYLVKTTSRVGIVPAPLDDATRRRLQSNSGIQVSLVVEGTPAFQADVLAGDVVLAVAGEPIQSPEHYIQLLDKYEDQSVAFRIDRDGKSIEKQLAIRHYAKPAR